MNDTFHLGGGMPWYALLYVVLFSIWIFWQQIFGILSLFTPFLIKSIFRRLNAAAARAVFLIFFTSYWDDTVLTNLDWLAALIFAYAVITETVWDRWLYIRQASTRSYIVRDIKHVWNLIASIIVVSPSIIFGFLFLVDSLIYMNS